MINQKSAPKKQMIWEWIPAEIPLMKITHHQKKTEMWSLHPSISLTSPSEIGFDPSVRLFIDTQKSFSYSEKIGCFWHKTWKLPNISVRLQVTNEHSGKPLMTPKNIYCEICCVIKENEPGQTEKYHLRQIHMKGNNKQDMIDGQCFYEGLQFSASSQSMFGQHFHLLAIIYIQEKQNEKIKILTAVLSPKIFVISKTQSYEFTTEEMETFLKLTKIDAIAKQEVQKQLNIRNDAQELYKYIQNPGVSKHPILLAMAFSNHITLMYHPKNAMNSSSQQINIESSILINFQKKFLDENSLFFLNAKRNATDSKNKKTLSDYEKMSFLICLHDISDAELKNSILNILREVESSSFGVIYKEENEELPNLLLKFKFINRQKLFQGYKESYYDLEQLAKIRIQEQISEENSFIDSQAYLSVVKPIKINRMDGGQGFTYNAVSGQPRKQSRKRIICHTIDTVDRNYKPARATRHSSRLQNMQASPMIAKIQEEIEQQVEPQKEIQKNKKQSAFVRAQPQNNIPLIPQFPEKNNENPKLFTQQHLNANKVPFSLENGMGQSNIGLGLMRYPLIPEISPLPNIPNLPNSNLSSNFNMGNLNLMNNHIVSQLPFLDPSINLNTLMYNNLLLSSWLQSVRMNNHNLYEQTKKLQPDFKFAEPSSIENKYSTEQYFNQESLKHLNDQINLHRDLLSQIIYQNQLLGEAISTYVGPNGQDLNVCQKNSSEQKQGDNEEKKPQKKRKYA